MNAKLAIFAAMFLGEIAVGAPLSEEAFYQRCYKSITQNRPAANDTVLSAIRQKKVKAADACVSLLKGVQWSADVGQVDAADSVAKQVLKVFHRLHASWFSSKDFSAPDGIRAAGAQNIYDTTTPALYFTRALFQVGTRADSVIVMNSHLEPIRSNPGGPGVVGKISGAESALRSDEAFAAKGDLWGVREVRKKTISFYKSPTDSDPLMSFDAARHLGGGFLGSSPYLLMNVQEADDFRADGAVAMPRKWAKSFFKDALCRDLPVVRREDAEPFVVPRSAVAFRTMNGCVSCHTTMDRAAGLIRGFQYVTTMNAPSSREGYQFWNLLKAKHAKEKGWPAIVDADYAERPTNGVLYYRSYNGKLIDIPVTSVAGLGLVLKNQDEFYVCLAKRYYQYFTGINAEIGDIQDPRFGRDLNESEKMHREAVVAMGLQLKKTQNVLTLLESIIRSPNYRERDFGASVEVKP